MSPHGLGTLVNNLSDQLVIITVKEDLRVSRSSLIGRVSGWGIWGNWGNAARA